jgi:hypothetical protein
VQKAYHCPLLMGIPYAPEVAELGGAGVLVFHQPHHPISKQFGRAADLLAT